MRIRLASAGAGSFRRAGSAACLGLALAAIQPAIAVGAPFQGNQGAIDPGGNPVNGVTPANIDLTGFVLTISNPASNSKAIAGFHGYDTTDTVVGGVHPTDPGQFMTHCGAAVGGRYPQGDAFGCVSDDPTFEGGLIHHHERPILPGQTQSFMIEPWAEGRTTADEIPPVLKDINVVWADADCLKNEVSTPRITAAVTAPKFDQCDREQFGVPQLWAKRVGSSRVRLTITGAPAGWATRLFGASSRGKLKTAKSGTTLATIKAVPTGYPQFGVGTVKAGRSIRFVREAWTLGRARPILSPIAAVK
jgi:hypothetical protein